MLAILFLILFFSPLVSAQDNRDRDSDNDGHEDDEVGRPFWANVTDGESDGIVLFFLVFLGLCLVFVCYKMGQCYRRQNRETTEGEGEAQASEVPVEMA